MCDDNNINITYLLNVSKAESAAIGTKATLLIDGQSLAMTGTYASFAKILALQSREVVTHNIFGNSLTNVEINMDFITSLFMKGAIVFRSQNTNKMCRSELRRIDAYFDGCNSHGECHRYGRKIDQFTCCCDPG